MRRFETCVMLAVVASVVSAGAASAAPVYDYVFANDVYQVTPGGTVMVPVFLQETVVSGDTSVLGPNGAGLWGAGVSVVFGDAPQPSYAAGVRFPSDIMASSAFDIVEARAESTAAKLSLFSLNNPTVYGQEYSPGVYRVELGTFRFTAGSVVGESTSIRATDYDFGFDDVITSDLRVLDSSPIHDGMATIMVVPEPGTMALLAGPVLMGAVSWTWRRRATAG